LNNIWNGEKSMWHESWICDKNYAVAVIVGRKTAR
jgi:hypothetical protein